MTDKLTQTGSQASQELSRSLCQEQIMIDGVDVSGCERYPLHNRWEYGVMFCDGGCEKYPNCLFKQLARKTQLSIEQSKELIRLRQELKESTVKNRNLKQECEEYLKQRNNILEESKRYLEEIRKLQKSQFCVAYEKDCYKVCKQQNCAIKNSYRYRKALEEIEKYCENQISITGDLPFRTTASDILTIINKAKESE